jgi:hypothetical protein
LEGGKPLERKGEVERERLLKFELYLKPKLSLTLIS